MPLLELRSTRLLRCCLAGVALAAFLGACPAARAQLALPGAAAPSDAGAVAPEAQSEETAVRKRRAAAGEGEAGPAVAPKPPSEDSIAEKPLFLDGNRGRMEFQRSAGETRLIKLTFAGDRLSRSGENCTVEAPAAQLKLAPRDGDAGVRRYQVNYPDCPFSLDVLDGAVLVSTEKGACTIASSDCRVDPNGLWGMGAAEFDPKNAKDMLNMRARVEKTVRADFRALYDKNKKDRPLRAYLVREQAGFSSRREEICRNYAQEADFGYCALRITEARALKLGTEVAKGLKLPQGVALDEPKKEKRIGK
ncbi:MAG: hypothetical protein WAK01_15305 [Methylocystis sp.]